MRRFFLVLIMFFGLVSFVSASDLVLKSGEKVTGSITEKTDQYVKIDSGVGMAVTYYLDEVGTIDGQPLVAPVVPPVAASAPQAVVEEIKPVEDIKPPVEEVKPPVEDVNPTVATNPVEVIKPVEVTKPVEVIPVAQPPAVVAQAIPLQTAVNDKQKSPGLFTIKDKGKMSLFSTGLGFGILGIILLFFVICYVVFTFPIYKIALKLNEQPAWLAWIPFVQIYLMCKMGKRPYWVLAPFVLSYVPVIGFVFALISLIAMIYIWMGISEARGKSPWLGILTIVPIANIVFVWYLALSE